jgi:ABC-type dipeptide/oligopeptide/nickel transport system permease subunit
LPDHEPTTGQDTLVEDEEESRLEDAMTHAASGGLQAESAVATAAAVEGGVSEYQASLWGDAWRQLRKNPLFIIASVLLIVFTVMAIAPGLFTTRSPEEFDLSRSVEPPSSEHWFGIDILGHDYYTRVIYGTRVSLIIGLLVVAIDVVIAIVLGSIAGYYGRFWDGLIGRMADIWFALPTTLAGIVFLNVMGKRGLLQVSFVLIFLGWPTLMRLMRSSVLAGRESDYVLAARALGASNLRILRVHILPNGIAPVIVYGTISVGIIISAEAALSFLGVGLQLPAISWGLMISAAQNRILQSPHLLLFPALFLSTLVLCFIIIGDALRDALDPRLR